MHCPACGVRMTARPVDVDERLARAPAQRGGPLRSGAAALPLVALVDNVRSLWNVGSMFRTADGCGIAELWLCGITAHPPRPEISKTALGAETSVAWSYRADALEALAEIAARGYVPVAVETTSTAKPLEGFDWPRRVCLVVGNEVAGIAPALLAACPLQLAIPMRGSKDSLNVAVAFGVAAYRAAAALDGTAGPDVAPRVE